MNAGLKEVFDRIGSSTDEFSRERREVTLARKMLVLLWPIAGLDAIALPVTTVERAFCSCFRRIVSPWILWNVKFVTEWRFRYFGGKLNFRVNLCVRRSNGCVSR